MPDKKWLLLALIVIILGIGAGLVLGLTAKNSSQPIQPARVNQTNNTPTNNNDILTDPRLDELGRYAEARARAFRAIQADLEAEERLKSRQ